MKKNVLYILAFSISLFSFSCSSDDDNPADTVAPVITLNEPHEDEEFHPGETIHFDATFTDNVQLSKYKIEIHYAGDGHSHGRMAAMHDDHDDHEEWDYDYEGDLSGVTMSVHKDIEVPHIVNGKHIKEGEYHFGVYAIDAAGNQSVVYRDIFIVDDHED